MVSVPLLVSTEFLTLTANVALVAWGVTVVVTGVVSIWKCFHPYANVHIDYDDDDHLFTDMVFCHVCQETIRASCSMQTRPGVYVCHECIKNTNVSRMCEICEELRMRDDVATCDACACALCDMCAEHHNCSGEWWCDEYDDWSDGDQ